MPIVFLNTLCCSYDNKRLWVDSVEFDLVRILTDSHYLDQLLPGHSAVCKFILTVLHCIDDGIYVLYTSGDRTTNLLSGVYTDTGEFDTLVSFQSLLRQILLF